jgi:hypothetical protein
MWGPFLTSPLVPRGEICPLGVMFTPSFTPWGEHSLLFQKNGGSHPQGISSPLGDKVHFAPRGEVNIGTRGLSILNTKTLKLGLWRRCQMVTQTALRRGDSAQ